MSQPRLFVELCTARTKEMFLIVTLVKTQSSPRTHPLLSSTVQKECLLFSIKLFLSLLTLFSVSPVFATLTLEGT